MIEMKASHRNLLLSLGATALLGTAAHAAGPYQFHTVTPCRVLDTRTAGGPLANPGPHSFTIQGRCGIPIGAAAATMNVTITSPTQAGDLRLFPAGQALPVVSTLNYPAGEAALANGAIVPLGAPSAVMTSSPGTASNPDLLVQIGMVAPGSVHVIVDVTGYFQ
jgi:hypothetical protein